jgi:O-antigen/teichoic acid export membrane protein
MTDGRSLVRNSLFNIAGLVIPLLLAVAVIPPLVRGYGPERFGILTLAWAAIGYFSLFDAGLSRALTQAVARRASANGAQEVAPVVWTTLITLAALGVIAAIVVVAAAPFVVARLSLEPGLHAEAHATFLVLAISLPLVLTTAGLRGLLEAHHDFATVNAIRIPMAAATFIGPLVVLPFSRSLVPAVMILVLGRVIGWIAHVVAVLRRYPWLRRHVVVRAGEVLPLLRFGGWATVTNIIGPLLVYMDRFVIGAVLTVSAVTFYVTPYEVVTKLIIIPGAVLTAMFPAFAATFETDRSRMATLYDRSQRVVLLIVFPLVLPAIALAHEGLRLWMGNVLPPESALVLQWLGIGVFINAMAHAPHSALQGAGRPDLVAKVHLAELPLYLVALWFLLQRFGIVGVAMAWTLRASIDTLALLYVGRRHLGLELAGAGARAWTVVVLLGALALAMVLPDTLTRILYVVVVGTVFTWIMSRRLLTPTERSALIDWLRSSRIINARSATT